jgi:hypothetical protein
MYTIADISIWPWIYALHENYDNAAEVSASYDVRCKRWLDDASHALIVTDRVRGFWGPDLSEGVVPALHFPPRQQEEPGGLQLRVSELLNCAIDARQQQGRAEVEVEVHFVGTTLLLGYSFCALSRIHVLCVWDILRV